MKPEASHPSPTIPKTESISAMTRSVGQGGFRCSSFCWRMVLVPENHGVQVWKLTKPSGGGGILLFTIGLFFS